METKDTTSSEDKSTGRSDLNFESRSLKALSYGVLSDVGRRREENQDFYGIIETESYRFFVVADGMGGAKGGATASHMAINTVADYLGAAPKISEDIISLAVQRANMAIYQKGAASEDLAGMGTTFVGLAFSKTSLFVVNVGDSRAYRIRSGKAAKIQKLTNDHTLVMELLKSGAISIDQVENHPVAHMLTRSLGPASEVAVDCYRSSDGPVAGDRYLLCSDGLYNLVEEGEILEIVANDNSEAACKKLVDLANQRGGTDNITVLIVHVGEEYPLKIEDVEANGVIQEDPFMQTPPAATKSAHVKGNISNEVKAAQIENRQKLLRSTIMVGGLIVSAIIFSFATLRRVETSGESAHKQFVGGTANNSDFAPVEPADNSQALSTERIPFNEEQQQTTEVVELMPTEVEQLDVVPPEDTVQPSREEVLRSGIKELESKIEFLNQPLSGQLIARLRDAENELARVSKDQVIADEELTAATRKMVVWYGRQQKIKSSDPAEIASEVAVMFDSVREKKDSYEKSSWAYLKEVELWRYNPGDVKLTEEIKRLGAIQVQKRRELSDVIKESVESAVQDAERAIAELTHKKDILEQRKRSLEEEIRFVKIVTGSNERAKFELRHQLLKDRDVLRLELGE